MIDKFYNDVESLGLKFPVAAISEQTGFSKGNVSVYLSRKKQPSESFLKKFYAVFGKSFKNVPRGTDGLDSPLPVGDLDITLKDHIDEIKSTNEYLKGLLALSLNDLSSTQKDMYAHLKGAIKRQAERFSKMDPSLVQEELDKISIYAAEYQGIDLKKGSHDGAGKR